MSPTTNVNTEKKPADTPKKVLSASLLLRDDYLMMWMVQYEITQADLLQALKTTRPSVSREELDRLGRM